MRTIATSKFTYKIRGPWTPRQLEYQWSVFLTK
jgi:hypothetical protein